MNINSLSRTLNGNVKYLKYALDNTSIDICQEETKLSVYVELYATSTCGMKCEYTAVYEIDVKKICDVEVEAECVLAYDINTDCSLIPPSEETEECEVVVEYSYIVTNTIPKYQTVDKVMWNFNVNNNDLT